jgi:hypothetical protein
VVGGGRGGGTDVLRGAAGSAALVPDIGRDDLIRYFTLTQVDVAFVDPGRGRGPADRLGLAVQLCTLPWLGFVPNEVGSAPPVAVARLAERLGLDAEALEGYGRRSHTRGDHLLLVARYLGWKGRACQRRGDEGGGADAVLRVKIRLPGPQVRPGQAGIDA